jgi:formylglycine-generating enzyme required for sulfatase activity
MRLDPQLTGIEWVHIPAGAFWMGSEPTGDEADAYLGQPRHSVYLADYCISRTPITNDQYLPFVQATGYRPPDHWVGGEPLAGVEEHPVTFVAWEDARAYCAWLEGQLQVESCELKVWRDGQLEACSVGTETLTVRLPTEAEWEKAARGTDGRVYPWGDAWEAARCSTVESGGEGTTPVRAFPGGISPYGVLDVAGGVWEWTSSARAEYPYDADDGREDKEGAAGLGEQESGGGKRYRGGFIDYGVGTRRIVRGGSFLLDQRYARCAIRYGSAPDRRTWVYGFRACCVMR